MENRPHAFAPLARVKSSTLDFIVVYIFHDDPAMMWQFATRLIGPWQSSVVGMVARSCPFQIFVDSRIPMRLIP
jgi:hypothetical protein